MGHSRQDTDMDIVDGIQQDIVDSREDSQLHYETADLNIMLGHTRQDS